MKTNNKIKNSYLNKSQIYRIYSNNNNNNNKKLNQQLICIFLFLLYSCIITDLLITLYSLINFNHMSYNNNNNNK